MKTQFIKDLISVILMTVPLYGSGQFLSNESIIQGSENFEQYYDVAIDGFGPNAASLYIGNGVIGETSDILVTKRSAGETDWIRHYDSSGSEFGLRIIFTSDGGFAFTGWTTVNGSDDLLVVKCAEDGSVEWTKALGGSGIERGRDLDETPSGDIVVAGHTNTASMGLNDILVVKLDADGEILWRNRYGDSGNENGWDVETLSDGSHVISGNTGSVGLGFLNLALLKIESDGTLLWLKGFGSGDGLTAGTSADIDEDDNIYAGGWTDAAGAGNRDAYAAIFDSDGNLINDVAVGGEGFETANDIDFYSAFTTNIVLAGKTGSFDQSGNGLLQPSMVWLGAETLDMANFWITGTNVADGELFGVEVLIPLDFPSVLSAGLFNSIDTEDTDTYRHQGTVPGGCLQSFEVQTSSPAFGFQEGGMTEVDESTETEPSFTSSEIALEEAIDCLEIIDSTADVELTKLTLNPNPATDQFRIDACEHSAYTVFNSRGIMVEQGLYLGHPISVGDWSEGLYFVKTEECGTGKVVVVTR